MHRLDKDTSGLLVVAKTDRCHAHLAHLLKNRLMDKHYLALVHGAVREDEGLIDKPIGRHPKTARKWRWWKRAARPRRCSLSRSGLGNTLC